MANSEWQPIETAPKTGVAVIVGVAGLRPIMVSWRDGKWKYPFVDRPAKYTPTHWFPVPDPPEVEE